MVFSAFVLLSMCCFNRKWQGKKYGWFVLVLGLTWTQTDVAACTGYLQWSQEEQFEESRGCRSVESSASLFGSEEMHDDRREKRQFSYRDIQFECYGDWDIMTGEFTSNRYQVAVTGLDFSAMVVVSKTNYDLFERGLNNDMFVSMMQGMGMVIVGDVFDIRCGLNGMYAGQGFYCRSTDGLFWVEYHVVLINSRTMVVIAKQMQEKADLKTSEANLIDSTLVYDISGLNR